MRLHFEMQRLLEAGCTSVILVLMSLVQCLRGQRLFEARWLLEEKRYATTAHHFFIFW